MDSRTRSNLSLLWMLVFVCHQSYFTRSTEVDFRKDRTINFLDVAVRKQGKTYYADGMIYYRATRTIHTSNESHEASALALSISIAYTKVMYSILTPSLLNANGIYRAY